jgi:hypothetical protein
MSEENKQSRKERNAELKAKYEAEKAEKKAKREAKKAARTTKSDTREDVPAPNAEQVGSPLEQPEVTPAGPISVEPAEEAPSVSTWSTAAAVPTNDTAWADAARGESSAWEQAVEPSQPTRREQREEKKAQKIEAALSKTSTKRQKRGGFPPEVSKLLMEKKLILAQWRSRKIDPNQAVERLSALVATCADGTTWRLLPRPGGAALVKTLEDGTTEIVEPPQRRRPVLTLLIAVLFGAFVAIAIWSSFDPVTSGGNRTTTTTSVAPRATTTSTAGG